jgi:hypothetical protein
MLPSKRRTKADVAKTRQAILDHFDQYKSFCRPHPAMRYNDLQALVKEGKLEKEVRRIPRTGNPLEGAPPYVRLSYYKLVRQEEPK